MTRCPACLTRDKGRGKYLCYDCWHELPLRTRRALNRQDQRAMARLRELHDQLTKGMPLARIEVTP